MATLMDRITAASRVSGRRPAKGGAAQPRRPARRALPSYAYGSPTQPLVARAAASGREPSVEAPTAKTEACEPSPAGGDADPRAYETASGAVRTWIVALLFLAPAILPILAATPVHDPDIWWHLATGRWIWQHGAVPHVDPFHLGSRASEWVAYSWLYDLGVYKLYLWFGLQGLFVYAVGISLAITAALYHLIRRFEPRFLVSCLLTAGIVTAVWPYQGARTFLITILFTAVELNVLWSARRGRSSALLVLPPLFVLWANLHIQFVYGLAIIGLAVTESILDRNRGFPRSYSERNGFALRWLVPVSLACCAATLVNPYGWKVYGVVVQYVTQAAPWVYLPELRAPTFRNVFDWLSLAAALGGAFCLGKRRSVRSFPVALLVLAAFLSFHAMRDAWVVVLVGGVLIADTGTPLARPKRNVARVARAFKVSAAAAAMIVLVWLGAKTSQAELAQAAAVRFPAKAADYVAEHDYAGRVYNHFDWGGYLIWRLPKLQVAIDGRTNLYGDRRLERSMVTWDSGEGWKTDPELAAADVVIAGNQYPLASMLSHDERFRRVYDDDLASVFVPVRR